MGLGGARVLPLTVTPLVRFQSWEQTYLLWTPLTKFLVQFPKFKGEEVVDMAHRSGAKRRASHQNTEHELDDNLNEWVNMTGFLCALGSVALNNK